MANMKIEMPAARTADWFRWLGWGAAAWMAFGIVQFVYWATLDRITLPPLQREVAEATPAWNAVFFAGAVFLGMAGAVQWVRGRSSAVPLLLVSAIAATVQFGSLAVLPETRLAMQPSMWAMPIFIIAVGWALWFVARRGASRGWLARP